MCCILLKSVLQWAPHSHQSHNETLQSSTSHLWWLQIFASLKLIWRHSLGVAEWRAAASCVNTISVIDAPTCERLMVYMDPETTSRWLTSKTHNDTCTVQRGRWSNRQTHFSGFPFILNIYHHCISPQNCNCIHTYILLLVCDCNLCTTLIFCSEWAFDCACVRNRDKEKKCYRG